MLMNFMDANLYQTQGRAISNFERLLTLTEDYKEKELGIII